MPAFADCLGNWRPDFLLTDNEKPSAAPGIGFQICEINSRSPINAILHSAAKHAMMRNPTKNNCSRYALRIIMNWSRISPLTGL